MQNEKEELGFYESNTDEYGYFNFHLAENNFVEAHFHESTEMIFVKKGNVEVIINGEKRLLKEGEIAVFNRYDVHFINGEKNSFIYVLVFNDSFDDTKNTLIFDNFLPVCESTENIFSFLDLFYKFTNDSSKEMKSCFVVLLKGILAKSYSHKNTVDKKTNSFIEILDYVRTHYRENINLDSICKKFGYTRNYFSTLFNNYTGMHLRAYINKLRIAYVNDMIKSRPDDQIYVIAYEAGFSSLTTFYRALKTENNQTNWYTIYRSNRLL